MQESIDANVFSGVMDIIPLCPLTKGGCFSFLQELIIKDVQANKNINELNNRVLFIILLYFSIN